MAITLQLRYEQLMRRPTHAALFLLICPLVAAATIEACVGDDPAKAISPDSGTPDSSTPADSSVTPPDASGDSAIPDAAVDGADSAGPQCVYPTSDAGVPGSLDQSFANSTHPEVLSPVDGEVDSAGNTYVLGFALNCVTSTSDYDLALYKFGPTGAADATFGTNGRVCVTAPVSATIGSERPAALRIDPSGNIVIVGTTGNGGFSPVQAIVARVKPTGQLDLAFGNAGVFTTAVATVTFPMAYAVNFDRSVTPAKVLVAGADGDPFKANTGGFVMRLTATGQLDSGFNGAAPVVDKNVTGYYGIAADATGAVLATGSAAPQRDLVVSKWSQAGTPAAFGTGGKVTLASVSTAAGGVGAKFSEGRSLVPASGGRWIVGGLQDAESGPTFVARLTAAGALDTTFASTSTLPGVLTLPRAQISSDYTFGVLRPRCDGRYLVSGYDAANMTVARVSAGGALETFGDLGVAVSASVNTIGVAAFEDPTSGKVVLMGRNGSGQLVLERYLP